MKIVNEDVDVGLIRVQSRQMRHELVGAKEICTAVSTVGRFQCQLMLESEMSKI